MVRIVRADNTGAVEPGVGIAVLVPSLVGTGLVDPNDGQEFNLGWCRFREKELAGVRVFLQVGLCAGCLGKLWLYHHVVQVGTNLKGSVHGNRDGCVVAVVAVADSSSVAGERSNLYRCRARGGAISIAIAAIGSAWLGPACLALGICDRGSNQGEPNVGELLNVTLDQILVDVSGKEQPKFRPVGWVGLKIGQQEAVLVSLHRRCTAAAAASASVRVRVHNSFLFALIVE